MNNGIYFKLKNHNGIQMSLAQYKLTQLKKNNICKDYIYEAASVFKNNGIYHVINYISNPDVFWDRCFKSFKNFN